MVVLVRFSGCIWCCWFQRLLFRARIGDGGFMLACISGCRGVIGFKVATSQCPVRKKVRPAGPGGGCEREKVRHARLVGGDSGRKLAMRGQNAQIGPFWASRAEFCPAHAVRRGVQGEFCPGSGPAWFLLGEFCSAMVPSVSPVTGLPSPTGTATRPRRPPRAFHISTDTTEAGPRRIPPLVACGGRAVGAEKPAPETQCPSLSSETTATGASARTLSSSTSP